MKNNNRGKNSFVYTLLAKSQRVVIFAGTIAILAVATAASAAAVDIPGLSGIIDLVLTIAKIAGAVLAIWGIIQLGMSFSSQDSQARVKGILEIAGGVIVFSAGVILDSFGITF